MSSSFLLVLAMGLAGLADAEAAQPMKVRQQGRHSPDQVIVKYSKGAGAQVRERVAASVRGERGRRLGLVEGLESVRLPRGGMTAEAAVEALARMPGVEYAEPDYEVEAVAVPDDPLFSDLWGMASIGAAAAWDTTVGDSGFVVAVVDTGVDFSHPDLAANLWVNPGEIADNGLDDDGNGFVDDVRGWDFAYNDNDPFDGKGHGTHVAGTIAGSGNNGIGVAGVNWTARIMPVKFLNDSGSGLTSAAIEALNYAVANGARVSNHSWGGGAFSQALYDAIEAARDQGHLVVAAAGNGGSDFYGDNTDLAPFYPASYDLDNIIAVAAVNSADAKPTFSNFGASSVDLGAPGVGILSTYPGDRYAYADGTSMAAPHVSGVAALVWSQQPDWDQPGDYLKVRDQILLNVRPIAALAGKTVTGGGVDADGAVNHAVYPLETPSGPVATPVSTTSVSLSWVDTTTEWEYRVLRSADEGVTWVEVGTTGLNVTSFLDTGLGAGAEVSYQVQAANHFGVSAPSIAVSVQTPGGTPTMHVESIVVTLSTARNNTTTATAAVKVVNASNLPVASGAVAGKWTITVPGKAPSVSSATGTTSSAGVASIKSPGKKVPSGTVFTFTVTGVTHASYVYDAAASHVTTASITY